MGDSNDAGNFEEDDERDREQGALDQLFKLRDDIGSDLATSDAAPDGVTDEAPVSGGDDDWWNTPLSEYRDSSALDAATYSVIGSMAGVDVAGSAQTGDQMSADSAAPVSGPPTREAYERTLGPVHGPHREDVDAADASSPRRGFGDWMADPLSGQRRRADQPVEPSKQRTIADRKRDDWKRDPLGPGRSPEKLRAEERARAKHKEAEQRALANRQEEERALAKQTQAEERAMGKQMAELERSAGTKGGALSLLKDTATLQFYGVEGRATLPQSFGVKNAARNAIGATVSIKGRHAAMFTHAHHHGVIVQPERANVLPEMISVSYNPTKRGDHEAFLQLTSESGTLTTKLVGEALTAADNATADDGKGALAVATDIANLAKEYTTDIKATDAARDAFGARIIAAGLKLNARIGTWVADEGVTAAYATEQASQSSNTGDVLKFLALELAQKGLEVAAMSNPVSMAAVVAVDLGWDMRAARGGNEAAAGQRAETVRGIETASSWARGATGEVTQKLVQKYSSLMSGYDVAKSKMFEAAGKDSTSAIGDIHGSLDEKNDKVPQTAKNDKVPQTANRVRAAFETAREELHDVLRTIAAAGNQAEGNASQAFSSLMERYLRYRAGGDPDSKPHERDLVTTGYFDPVTASHPVRLTGTQVGSVNAAALSPSVAHHATRRPLAAMAAMDAKDDKDGWNVTIRLAGPSGGELVLWQRADGSRIQLIPDSEMPAVDRLGGIPALWNAVDRTRTGQ